MNRRSIYSLNLFGSVVLMQCQAPTDLQPPAVLRERPSGALLFMGKIMEPVWEG